MDLSSCSDSMLSGMVNAYELYQPRESSDREESRQTFLARNYAVDEILADNNPLTIDNVKGKGKSFGGPFVSSHSLSQGLSSSASQEETHCPSPTEEKSLGDGSHPLVDGCFERTGDLTFVLSSGRMSQDQGIAPTQSSLVFFYYLKKFGLKCHLFVMTTVHLWARV
jgi:hypothetical protein